MFKTSAIAFAQPFQILFVKSVNKSNTVQLFKLLFAIWDRLQSSLNHR